MEQRSTAIDVMKGLLTFGMVLAHVIRLIAQPSEVLRLLMHLIDLVCFSGFFFCFGFGTCRAYFSKHSIPWSRVLKTALRCYLAFIVSGLASLVLLSGECFSIRTLIDLSLLRTIPSYSEFLLSFSIIVLLAALLMRLINLAIYCPRNLISCSLFCLFITALPKSLDFDPIIGLFIGGSKFNYFPVIQYLPMFLLGAYFSRHSINPQKLPLMLSLIPVGLFILLTLAGFQTSRFPPSAAFIIISASAVYLCYGIGNLIADSAPKLLKLSFNVVGQNSLIYLLLSNLILFILFSKSGFQHNLSFPETLFAYGAIMLFIFVVRGIGGRIGRAGVSA